MLSGIVFLSQKLPHFGLGQASIGCWFLESLKMLSNWRQLAILRIRSSFLGRRLRRCYGPRAEIAVRSMYP